MNRGWIFSFVIALTFMLLTSAAWAREIKVGIGFALPPYVISENDQGLEVDAIREALAHTGHTAKFVYLPNLRLPLAFVQGTVDCVAANANYDLERDSGRKGFHSNNTIAYQNAAITIEKNGLFIRSIHDLCRNRVLGFNNATKYLGPEYLAAVSQNHEYSELADQSLQVRMLLSGRVDVVVSDVRIFLWWLRHLRAHPIGEELNTEQALQFNKVFPPALRRVTFAAEADRDDFNRGLEELKSSGRLEEIIEHYIGNQYGQ